MEDLLQRLWDKYRELVDAVDVATDDVTMDDNITALTDAICDTKEMAELRGGLYKAGVKDVPGIDYSL